MWVIDHSRFRRLAKEGTWILSGQIASILGALVLVRMLTEYLEPEEYGQLTLGLTIVGLVNQVVMGGVTAGIGRFYSIAAEKNDLTGYMRASQRLMIIATVIVLFIALVLVVGLFWLGRSQWIALAAAALLLSVLGGYNSAISGIQNAARQRAVVAFHGGFDAWLKILLAVGLILWLGTSSTAVLLGYALSSLLVTGSQLIFLRQLMPLQKKKSIETFNWGSQIWLYSWPFSAFGIFTWMQQISDRWALQSFVSDHAVGLYAVVFQLGYVPIGLVTGMAMTFLAPILYNRSGAAINQSRNISVHRIAWSITFACLLITVLAFVLTLLLHERIFQILVAPKYQAVSNLLPWMVLAGGVFAGGQMLALKLMSEMKPAVITIAKIVTAILGVGLNVYGASLFGIQGVVAALVAVSFVYFFWMAWLALFPPASVNHHFPTS
jgi:O-antigen/teichoic acid export membrane protein